MPVTSTQGQVGEMGLWQGFKHRIVFPFVSWAGVVNLFCGRNLWYIVAFGLAEN